MQRIAGASRLEENSLSYWRIRILFTILFTPIGVALALFITGTTLDRRFAGTGWYAAQFGYDPVNKVHDFVLRKDEEG